MVNIIVKSDCLMLFFRKVILATFILFLNYGYTCAHGNKFSESSLFQIPSFSLSDNNPPQSTPRVLSGILIKDTVFGSSVEANLYGNYFFSEIAAGEPDLRSIAFIFFFAGILVIMFLYHLGLNFYSSQDKSSFVFGLLLLFMAFKIILTSHDILMLLFPETTWGGYYKLRYGTTYVAPVFFILLIKTLFKEESKGFPLFIISGISLVAGAFVIFTPPGIFIKTHVAFNVFLVFVSSILVFIAFKAFLKKERGGLLIFAGHMTFYMFLLYSLIFSGEKADGDDYFTLGFLAFIITLSYALSIRFWNSYLAIRNPEAVVEHRNNNLEQILKSSSEDLINQKNLLEEINRELQDQREDMLTQSEMMADLNQLLEQEMQKSDNLLLNILPKKIAHELKLYGKAPSYSFPSVSVLFIDFVDFSEIVEKVNAQALVDTLHNYFMNFDDVIRKYNLEKIKTIGDAYMCAGGLRQEANEEDAQLTVFAALELAEFMQELKEEKKSLDEVYFDFRIGIHTGAVIAGVVGKSKFVFDIWGQTVNIAKETESACLPGKVTISESTYRQVKDKFTCVPRGEVIIKHNRKVQMYFVEGKI